MADNPNQRGTQDRSRISLDQEHEVRYWTRELGLTEEELRAVIRVVGNSPLDVREYLKG